MGGLKRGVAVEHLIPCAYVEHFVEECAGAYAPFGRGSYSRKVLTTFAPFLGHSKAVGGFEVVDLLFSFQRAYMGI
jgi:hypothetical protein